MYAPKPAQSSTLQILFQPALGSADPTLEQRNNHIISCPEVEHFQGVREESVQLTTYKDCGTFDEARPSASHTTTSRSLVLTSNFKLNLQLANLLLHN